MTGADVVARGLAVQARAAYASLREPKAPMVGIAVGDSITNGSSSRGSNIQGANCWWNIVQWLSAGRIVFRKQIGVPGNTSAQILTRLRDEALGYPGLDFVALMQGTNDLAAITAGTGTQAASLANDRVAIRAIHARGLGAILLAVPPSNASPLAAKALNEAKRTLAAQEGALFVDGWTPLADPAGFGYRSGTTYSIDGTHPTAAGSKLIAQAFLGAVAPVLPRHTTGAMTISGDLASTIPNAQMLVTSTVTAGTQAANHSLYGSIAGYTLAMVAGANPNGNLQRFTLAGTTSGSAYFEVGGVDVAPYAGRRMRLTARLRTSGLETSGVTVGLRLRGTDAHEGANLNLQLVDGLALDGDGMLHGEVQVPAGSSMAAIQLQITGAGPATIDYGELAIGPAIDATRALIDTRTAKPTRKVRQVSAATTLTLDDDVVLVDATAAGVTITLPGVGNIQYNNNVHSGYGQSVPGGGLTYTIIKVDTSANAVLVAPPSGTTINGSESAQAIAQPSGKLRLLSTSANRYFVE